MYKYIIQASLISHGASSLHFNYLMTYKMDHITPAPKSGSSKYRIGFYFTIANMILFKSKNSVLYVKT